MRGVRAFAFFVFLFISFSSHSHDRQGSGVIHNETQLLAATARAGAPWCRQACFESETEAHLQAGRRFLVAALASKREVSWRVYVLDDGTYTFSWPSAGERGATKSRMPPLDTSSKYVSSGHIHWDEVSRFSAQDWIWITSNNRRLYLVTRKGTLREATPSRARKMGRYGNLALRAARPFRGRFIARINP